MEIQEYLSRMTKIQDAILAYIENDNSAAENFVKLITLFRDLEIQSNQHYLKTLLHILSNISDNHHRGPNFFGKIQKILRNLKIDIKKNFSNFSIFNVFKSNKRLLLLLIQEQIMSIDSNIASKLINELDYTQYLYNYLTPFFDEDFEQENPENFKEKQKIGENDSQIAILIREDNIDEFVSYVKKEKISLFEKIKKSIFESNSFLAERYSYSLIEYAAFFGSIKILNYLHSNGAELESRLWLFAIHSQNLELIQFLEDKKVELEEKSYKKCLQEAIKCHHKNIIDYIQKKERENLKYFTNQCLKYFNIYLIQNDFINESTFSELCQYDYYTIVDIFLKKLPININKLIIFKIILFNFNFNISMIFKI